MATDSQQLAGELAAMMDEQHEFLARTGTGPAESDSPQVRPGSSSSMPIPSHAPIPIASTNYASRQGLSPSQLTPPATHNLSALAACCQRPHQIAIGATGTGKTTLMALLTMLLPRLIPLEQRHAMPMAAC